MHGKHTWPSDIVDIFGVGTGRMKRHRQGAEEKEGTTYRNKFPVPASWTLWEKSQKGQEKYKQMENMGRRSIKPREENLDEKGVWWQRSPNKEKNYVKNKNALLHIVLKKKKKVTN